MKEPQEYNQFNFLEDTDNIDLKEEIEKYLIYWRWFLVGLFLALLSAFLYLKYTPKSYSASAYIMIKDNLKSGISDELKAVSDLGIVGTSSTNNPENEIFIIKSRKIVGKMVDSLELNIRYFNTVRAEIYKNRDIEIDFIDKNKDALHYSIDTAFVVSFSDERKLCLKNLDGDVLKYFEFNEIIKSKKLGNFKIKKNTPQNFENDIIVAIKPRKNIISSYASKIKITALSDFSSILHLEVVDYNKRKAENLLDELIKQYNLDAVIDKNIVSKKTITFIESRLKSVGFKLASIQDSLKAYKIKHGISGNPIENEIALKSNSQNKIDNNYLKTQLALIEWIKQEIEKKIAKNEILPANLGFSDEIIAKTINEINTLLLERNKLLRFSGEKNPILIELDNRIKSLKQNLHLNLKNLKKSINIKLKNVAKEEGEIQERINQIPFLERGIIDTYRQKVIYSELYSYLLKKKEEIAISLAVTVPNAKIIDVAFSSGNPVFPKKKNIYLIAILIGFLLPFSLIFIKIRLDTKIHNRKDIEDNLDIPYLGDIPHSELKGKVIVKNNSRTSVAEAFRLLRTNLNFMLPKVKHDSKGKLIFVTSTISGEGKSFVSLNLASTLALTNKKVLLVGLDLRAPKITDYLDVKDRKGVSNYILDDSISLDEIKFNIPDIKNVDFIASGLIPPNPSELLLHSKVEELFEIVKNDYDYIIVDTAPVSLVTDTLLIAELADVFLYVVRANHLDKKMLVVPRTLYTEKKLPNMAIVLNDTDASRGYGYGYGYVEKEKKPFYKSILGL
jgi:capsular exopolysaccharide synthesis family protein